MGKLGKHALSCFYFIFFKYQDAQCLWLHVWLLFGHLILANFDTSSVDLFPILLKLFCVY